MTGTPLQKTPDTCEDYPLSSIVIYNLVIALWILTGTACCWLFLPLAGAAYLAFAVLMMGLILRKVVCTRCVYHGRRCATGWGKFSACLFSKGDESEFGKMPLFVLVPLTYGLLSSVPVILMAAQLLSGFALEKIALLAVYLILLWYSAFAGRKKFCSVCEMREKCPGSAAGK